MKRLFDENGMLNIADIVAENPSYKAIMEDGVVTDQELKDQAAGIMQRRAAGRCAQRHYRYERAVCSLPQL